MGLPFFHDFEFLIQISCFYRIPNRQYSQKFAFDILVFINKENT